MKPPKGHREEKRKSVSLKKAAKTYSKGRKTQTLGSKVVHGVYGQNPASDARAAKKHPGLKMTPGVGYARVVPDVKVTNTYKPKARQVTLGSQKKSGASYVGATKKQVGRRSGKK